MAKLLFFLRLIFYLYHNSFSGQSGVNWKTSIVSRGRLLGEIKKRNGEEYLSMFQDRKQHEAIVGK